MTVIGSVDMKRVAVAGLGVARHAGTLGKALDLILRVGQALSGSLFNQIQRLFHVFCCALARFASLRCKRSSAFLRALMS